MVKYKNVCILEMEAATRMATIKVKICKMQTQTMRVKYFLIHNFYTLKNNTKTYLTG